MSPSFCFSFLLLALLTLITWVFVFIHLGTNLLLEIYTLLSSLLLFFLCILILAHYSSPDESHCSCSRFQKWLTLFVLLWNAFSFFVFFYSAAEFPPLSSYGAFSLLYLIIFSLPLFVLLVVGVANGCYSIVIYRVAFSSLQLFFLISSCITFGVDVYTYHEREFIAWNLLALQLTVILKVTTGLIIRCIREDQIHKPCQIIWLLIFQLIGGLTTPLVPASFLFQFITSMLPVNLFTEDFGFASLLVVSIYFLVLLGFILPHLHFYYEISQMQFQENRLKLGLVLTEGIHFCYSLASPIVLYVYLYLSQSEVPSLVGASVWLLYVSSALILLLHLSSMVWVASSSFDFNSFKKRRFKTILIKLVLLLCGIIMSSVLVGLAQIWNNAFYEYPGFSVFLLLLVFHFLYSGFIDILFNRLLLRRAQEYFRRREQERGESIELENMEEILELKVRNLEKKRSKEIKENLVRETCPICLSELVREGEREGVSRIKKCGHCFHTECISDWLTRNRSCPIDRRQL